MSKRFRLFQAALGLTAAVFFVMGLQAIEPNTPQTKGGKAQFNKEELAAKEKILETKYRQFEEQLLLLKQRLEKSADKKDQERAAQLAKVLDKSSDFSITTRFAEMVKVLSTQKLSKIGEVNAIMAQSARLAQDLKEILDLIRNTSSSTDKREERLRLEQLVKELEKLIREQKLVNGQIEVGTMNPKEVANNQKQVRSDTQAVAKKLGDLNKKDGKDGKGGEAKDNKADAKGAKGKGTKGEGKDAGKGGEGKKGDGKDGGKGGDPKKGEAKDGKQGAKSGEKKGDAKPGKAGDPKGGDAKSGKAGDPKGGEAKSGGKGGDPKKGDGKDAGQKGGDPKENKQGDAKGEQGSKVKTKEKDGDKGGAKAGDPKGGEKAGGAKAGDPKGGEKKDSAQSKGGQSKQSQGQSKAGKSSQGQGSPKSGGQPKEGDQPPPQGQPKTDGKQPDQGPQDGTADAKKKIQDSADDMRKVIEEITKKNKEQAGKDGDQAVEKLQAALKKLEDLLRQLREEELERLLTELKARCEKMLAMQIQVYNGTKAVARAIEGNGDKKPTRANTQDSIALSDEEKKIVMEASKAIEMLEAEGSAVAFHEVFQQVREDMKHVQRRLGGTDVGKVTQTIEQDIIDTLGEMIKALEKAKQDLDNKKPPQGQPGQPPPQADQKLLDKIAELKMVRAMQIRVNKRTEMYGNEFKGQEVPQDGNLQRELRNLAERQDRIFEVTNKIAKGDNQ